MRSLMLASFALLVLPCASQAACDGADNCLGIYFDEGEWTQNCDEPDLLTMEHVYFVLQNCTFDAIAGYEFGWRYAPEPAQPPLIVGAYLPGMEPWLTDYHNVIYGVWPPLVTTGPVVLMDLTLWHVVSYAGDLQLGPATPATLPGYAALNDYNNLWDIRPLNFGVPVDDEGWTVDGVARFGDCAVPTTTATWGGVKSLFR